MSILDKFKKNQEDAGKASVAKQVVEAEKEAKKSVAKKPAAKKKTTPKAKAKTETKKQKKAAQIVSKKATHALLGPVVSEKSAQLSDRGVIVFRVADDANKVEIRNAFRELYKVTPVRVNVMKVRGSQVRFGRMRGRTKDYKKAMITLPKGTRIDIFEGV